MTSSPTGMWASFARNGSRYHALTVNQPWDYQSACGMSVAEVGLTYDTEPDWDADVPCPPKPCPACRKALRGEVKAEKDRPRPLTSPQHPV